MADKLGLVVQFTSATVVSFTVAFFYSWKLTLVILSLTPMLVVGGALFAKTLAAGTFEQQALYATAGDPGLRGLGIY